MKFIILFLFAFNIFAVNTIETAFGEYDLTTSKNRLSQQILIPQSIAVNSKGLLYIVDTGNNKIRKVNEKGEVETVVGANIEGDSTGDPLKSSLKIPTDIAFTEKDELIISDTYNNKIKKLTEKNEIIVIAGTGEAGNDGDGKAIEKKINHPADIAFYNGEIYFIDGGNEIIRKITSDNQLVTVIGNGDKLFNIDEKIPVKSLKLSQPQALTFDKAGNLYVADKNGTMILKINLKEDTITHIAGNGKINMGMPIKIGWYPTETHIGVINSIFINPKNEKIYLVSSTHNSILYIGKDRLELYAGDGNSVAFYKVGPPQKSSFNFPTDFLIHNDIGYVVDKKNNYIREIKSNIVSIYVGLWEGKEELKNLSYPSSITTDGNRFFIADTLNYRVIQMNSEFKNPQIIAGTGNQGYFEESDERIAKSVNIDYINDIEFCNNYFFMADTYNNGIWKIEKDEITLTKFANTENLLNEPVDIECYENGIIILNKGNNILKADLTGKAISELINLKDYSPEKITVKDKEIIFFDSKTNQLFSIKDLKITPFCGQGDKTITNQEYLECTQMKFSKISAIHFSFDKNSIFVFDNIQSKLYEIKDNKVYHIAGDGKRGFNKSGGISTEISLFEVKDLLVFKNKLYIVDSINNLIRILSFDENTQPEQNKGKEEKTFGCDYSAQTNYISFGLLIAVLFFIKRKVKKA